MRQDIAPFSQFNEASARSPIFVVEIHFVDDVDVVRLTSNATAIPDIPGSPLVGYLQTISGVTPKLSPESARQTIGALTFAVVDIGEAFTNLINTKLRNDKRGLRQKRVRFWLGYEGLSWTDFRLIQTQRVDQVTHQAAAYRIACADINRAIRTDIFDQAETRQTIPIGIADATISVESTDGFERLVHGASYTDAPNSTVGYLELKSGEIVRYTGVTSTSFTGVTRGLFATRAEEVTIEDGASGEQLPRVKEFIYLELPAVKLAYAVLTGVLQGESNTLPAGWHLGLSESDLNDEWTAIGADLWNPDNDATGFVARFTHLSRQDGKRFLERDVFLLAGVFHRIDSEGRVGLRRMNEVTPDAATVATLDSSNVISVGDLVHDMRALANQFQVSWNYDGSQHTRSDLFVDAVSISRHGSARPQEFKFRGLHGTRHTRSIISQRVTALRDARAAPPLTLNLSVFGSLNRLEPGDLVRVQLPTVRDYAGNTVSLDRAMEVRQLQPDFVSGQIRVSLFGSSEKSEPTDFTEPALVLADSFYTNAGTNLDSVLPITAGVLATGAHSITGDDDLNAPGSVFYFAGDLEIPSGATLTINDNVQIRVRGFLTVNGTITGVGRGLSGSSSAIGSSGYVGDSQGMSGVMLAGPPTNTFDRFLPVAASITRGQFGSFPVLNVDYDQASGIINGLPADLRGTGGGRGGDAATNFNYPTGAVTVDTQGGAGADGGAGLAVVCRGMAFGLGGVLDLSGDDSAATATSNVNPLDPRDVYPGAGGSGGPGACLVLLDGATQVAPDMVGHFVADTGAVPVNGNLLPKNGAFKADITDPVGGYRYDTVSDGVDYFSASYRILRIPAPDDVEPDLDEALPDTALEQLVGSAFVSNIPTIDQYADAPDGFETIAGMRLVGDLLYFRLQSSPGAAVQSITIDIEIYNTTATQFAAGSLEGNEIPDDKGGPIDFNDDSDVNKWGTNGVRAVSAVPDNGVDEFSMKLADVPDATVFFRFRLRTITRPSANALSVGTRVIQAPSLAPYEFYFDAVAVSVGWPDLLDPDGTKPDDNATNTGVGGNLVNDPDFERSLVGPVADDARFWIAEGTAANIEFESNNGVDGSQNLLMLAGAGQLRVFQAAAFPLRLGDKVTVRVNYTMTSTLSVLPDMELREYDGGGQFIDANRVFQELPDNGRSMYLRSTLTFEAKNTSAVYGRLLFRLRDQPAGSTRIDEITAQYGGSIIHENLSDAFTAQQLLAGENVNNWNNYFSTAGIPAGTTHAFQIRLDRAGKRVHFRVQGATGGSSPILQWWAQLEVRGASVTSVQSETMDSSFEDLTGAGQPITNFDARVRTVGANGFRLGETVGADTAGRDEIVLNLDRLDDTTSFRLRVVDALPSEPGGAPSSAVTLGDRVIALGISTPLETIFAAVDSQDYDALLLLNGPAEPDADVTGDNEAADTSNESTVLIRQLLLEQPNNVDFNDAMPDDNVWRTLEIPYQGADVIVALPTRHDETPITHFLSFAHFANIEDNVFEMRIRRRLQGGAFDKTVRSLSFVESRASSLFSRSEAYQFIEPRDGETDGGETFEYVVEVRLPPTQSATEQHGRIWFDDLSYTVTEERNQR